MLLISGSLRAGSTNSALLRTVAFVQPDGVRSTLFDGMADLPLFNPDDDRDGAPVHPAVTRLRTALSNVDACLFATPEYAGALPGAFKNLLEWCIGSASLYGLPVAWLNASTSTMKAANAHASLRRVLDYAGADVVEEACATIPVRRAAVTVDGVEDPDVRMWLRDSVTALARARVARA